ncbi:A24 family peptidase [Variovorax boronicumulans]|uniref:A24 family peptidase n=1 Tax=Variovorax boronicumulans TaxID=436515 RepID=UPI0012E579E0|nr:A24 family peptidase [Variovorax boronicumulans]GER14334.1 prepilin peptidase [Variovorax boronicumulans]
MPHLWLLWLLLVTVYDARQRRVPNWLVLLGAAIALGALAMNTQPFGIKWPDALIGATLGFVFLLFFYVAGLMGAGDVKFAGALGLWVGWQPLLPIWAVASLLAAVHGITWLLLQRWALFPKLATLLSGKPRNADASGLSKRARPIPYAAYLALAATVWMIWGRQS